MLGVGGGEESNADRLLRVLRALDLTFECMDPGMGSGEALLEIERCLEHALHEGVHLVRVVSALADHLELACLDRTRDWLHRRLLVGLAAFRCSN